MSDNKLPSRFQIGADVSVRRESGNISMPNARVVGVQFTEAKIFYLVQDAPDDPVILVDSALVDEVEASSAQVPVSS